MKRMKRKNIKYREIIAYALEHGCTDGGVEGSHRKLIGPNGKAFPVKCNNPGDEPDMGTLKAILRQMRDAGVEVFF